MVENIFKNIKVHDSATAFLQDKSIKTNAIRHNEGRYFLKLDFKDFFPSINFRDFSPFVQQWIRGSDLNINEDELLNVIQQSCFYKKDLLPIGYPTSPIISNIVMYKFDTTIVSAITQKDIYGIATYTRYADDMTFSTDKKGACNEIITLVRDILKKQHSPKLTLNLSKTHFVSSSSGSAIVTGLRICHDGHITIHRKYKDKIRLMLSLYKKGNLKKEQKTSLKGHLAHIRHVDGAFYTKLQNKHFEDIYKILSQN